MDPHLFGIAICLLSQCPSPPQLPPRKSRISTRSLLGGLLPEQSTAQESNQSAVLQQEFPMGRQIFQVLPKPISRALLFKIRALSKRRADSSEIGKLLYLIQAINVPSGQQQPELPWQGPCLINSLHNMALEIPVLFHLWMPSTFLQHHRRNSPLRYPGPASWMPNLSSQLLTPNSLLF